MPCMCHLYTVLKYFPDSGECSVLLVISVHSWFAKIYSCVLVIFSTQCMNKVAYCILYKPLARFELFTIL